MRRTFVPLLAAVAAAGCQQSEYTFTEVEGSVTRAGKPQAGVLVCFWPDIAAGTKAPRTTAMTDAAGHYRLRCDEGTAGAVVGRYRVCLSKPTFGLAPRPAAPAPKLPGGKPAPLPAFAVDPAKSPPPATPAEPLPTCYASFKETPLRDVEVKAGEGVQTLDFDVTAVK